LLEGATKDTTIGVLSAPSAFVALKNKLVRFCSSRRPQLSPPFDEGSGHTLTTSAQRGVDEAERPKLLLLEHDDRFGVFSEFVFYDFQQPLKLPCECLPRYPCNGY
jgi:hypothetical protein